jgi:hypothetical protein
MSSDENTEVNVEVIGGAPELWETWLAVIVTKSGVVTVLLGGAAVVWAGVGLGCGVGLSGVGWVVGVGVLLVGRTVVGGTLDVGGGAAVDVVVVVGVTVVGGVVVTTGICEVVGVVTKQPKKVWSAIDY